MGTRVPWEDDMAFIDMGLTAAIVVVAFVFMIRHFMTGNSGCSSCKNCSKAGSCDTEVPTAELPTVPGRTHPPSGAA